MKTVTRRGVACGIAQAAAFGAGNNVSAVCKDRLNAKTIITTGNPDVIYGLGGFHTKALVES
jgi:hypothetical protein